MTHFPQKNVNLIQFDKRIVHVNHTTYPRFTDFEGRKPRGLFFFCYSQMHHETSELWNSSERPWKFSKIFGNSWIIFGSSVILQLAGILPTLYLPTYLRTYLPLCLVHTYLPTNLPMYLPTNLPAHLPTYLPTCLAHY